MLFIGSTVHEITDEFTERVSLLNCNSPVIKLRMNKRTCLDCILKRSESVVEKLFYVKQPPTTGSVKR